MKKLLTVMLLPLCVVGQRAYAESSSDTGNIAFADMEVKAICVQNWDTDGNGELSYAEAAVVTNLGRAFKDNAGITTFNELQYFTALEKISGQAFYNCSSLTSVTLPSNVKVIDQNAFYATGITSIELPASVTTIADAAFNGNANLSSITVSEGNTVYDSRNGCNGVIETSTNTLVLGCKNTVIPDGVTIIGSSAFRGCTTLTSIIFPQSVTAIGANAFRNCTNLTSAIIPSSVANIEADAFLYCYNLSSITVGRSVPFEWTSGNTFSNLANATLYVPAGSKSAYESAVVWNEFKEIVEIENIAFADSKVKEVCVSNWDTNGDGDLSYAEAAVVTTLGKAFKDNAGITTFNELQYFTALEKISGSAFPNCSSLTSVTLPSNVKVIEMNAFYASGIISIEIPASVDSIAVAAFNSCHALESITVEEGNSVYDSRNGCEAIIETATNTLVAGCKNTVIPNDVTAIGGSAFRSYETLTSINIPESVTSIATDAFYRCNNLTTVIVNSRTPLDLTNGDTFYYRSKATLYVPAGSKNAYENAPVWSEFKEIVEMEVPENMFVLNNMTLCAGQSDLFPVTLTNESEVVAFQCDIYLPEGVTLQLNNKGKYDIILDENRADDHTVTSALQDDGSLRIVVASLSSSVIFGNSGVLFYLNLLAEKGLTGEHPIAIKNIHVSTSDGTRYDLNDVSAIISISAFTPADVNNDGLIAVDDVVLTINGALGITADNFLFAAADMNADGQILVDDVVQVINSVLGISTANVMTTRSTMLESLTVADTEGGFNMNVTNAANYVAMQFDMTLPEGVSLNDIQVTSSSNHAVATREMEHGVVRVIVSSLTNDAFRGDQLLNVGVFVNETATIRLTNAYVATCGGTLVSVSDAEITRAGATGIHGIEKNATPANIYDFSGRLVKENATSTEGLQKGIYLMNGKKVVVK